MAYLDWRKVNGVKWGVLHILFLVRFRLGVFVFHMALRLLSTEVSIPSASDWVYSYIISFYFYNNTASS